MIDILKDQWLLFLIGQYPHGGEGVALLEIGVGMHPA